ncbi:hypothetical protein FEZ41_02230 [Lentilactobacillus parafarraginis]|mgnify:CR=1 FL=1|jgi:uncharacterized protein YvpB|uniref:Peptidase C39-like domain-containing protein n=2 Tax=Lentilactobacillus parafarraginis TaxID=390842 RepID=A0A0R1YN42_9LACO|nr:C39 family peptidase [Lentilactobacillus parafarraginis]KRM43514.1 hypothetical protein FD47_GL001535 [Lentilactobacillus parafarraginis DSM 18390 = JCM 14109]TLQ20554.1 hypothetical protein FEZ41_02230 [Lentilactobacillus parafarraginis]
MNQPILLGAENVNQLSWGAINGCEAASLLEGLHYQDAALGVSYGQFLLAMPIAQDGNPYHGFGGSPFKNEPGKFEAIFARPLLRWGNQFGLLWDLSGADPSWLYDEICRGNPVITYVTVHFATPQWEQYPFGRVPVNNHCVLLDGVSKHQVHVSDPIDGQYWLDRVKFEKIYLSRRMAAVVYK